MFKITKIRTMEFVLLISSGKIEYPGEAADRVDVC